MKKILVILLVLVLILAFTVGVYAGDTSNGVVVWGTAVTEEEKPVADRPDGTPTAGNTSSEAEFANSSGDNVGDIKNVSVPSGAWTEIVATKVPAGYNYNVCDWGCSAEADIGVALKLVYKLGGITIAIQSNGGRMGCIADLKQPVLFAAARTISVQAYQASGGDVNILAFWAGYRVAQ